MDRLDALAFFIRIIEKGGVAAAGRDFGMSATTASDRLSMLEAHYGATLLNRTTRSISLTEEGKLLLDTARHLVSEANDLKAQIKHGVERLSGLIRISATQDFGSNQLAPIINAFMDTHPDMEIALSLSDGYVDLVGQGFDLAVRIGALKDSSLMVKKLADNQRVICAAPSYLKAHGTPHHPDELANHNCLIMQFGPAIDREWILRVKGRERACAVHGNRMTNNGALMRRWCLEGRGLALKSIWDVRDDIEAGRLVEVLADFAPQTDSQLQIVYPGGGKPNRRIRALIDYIVAGFDA